MRQKYRIDSVKKFWSKVNKNGSIPDYAPYLGPCWLWTGTLYAGYGYIGVNYKGIRAHRYNYELLVGPIPEDLQIDHLCKVKNCVNPAHLEPVTLQENVRRGEASIKAIARQRAKTHCPRGHEYNFENTIVYRGNRSCRICCNFNQNERRHKARELT